MQTSEIPAGLAVPGAGQVAQSAQVMALWPPVQAQEFCGEWGPNPDVQQAMMRAQAQKTAAQGAAAGLGLAPEA